MDALLVETRDVPPRAAHALAQSGVHPLLARLYAARGVRDPHELDDALTHLLPPSQMHGCEQAAVLLADAIAQQHHLCIVADYDCDGATACAVGLRGLRMLGAPASHLHHVVPDRAVHGYGLTPTIVDLVAQQAPATRLLLTVDNGIASIEGIAHARAMGMKTLVTDHHLPARDPASGQVLLPAADVIVNPNQPACGFASKSIAGVGVMFYVLLALRGELRRRGAFDADTQPRLDALLDLVALGTVADVVRLDANNRRLVAQGLSRIRKGRMQPGIAALLAVAGRDAARARAQDFGFALGPRINAAGRLSDMSLGIECLCTDDAGRAAHLAAELDRINRQRREVEDGMKAQAQAVVERIVADCAKADDGAREASLPAALSVYDPGFHEGVVGIVAGRLKDSLHRPVFVLARGQDGLVKGSGRSIPGFHLRDALDLISKRHPGLLLRFGGHAMAAGCTLEEEQVAQFAQSLGDIAHSQIDRALLQRRLTTDGPLPEGDYTHDLAQLLEQQVWGQGFEAPLFCDRMDVLQQRLVQERHLKLTLRPSGDPGAAPREAIWFNHIDALPDQALLAYRIGVDEWQGRKRVQMLIEAVVRDTPQAGGNPIDPCTGPHNHPVMGLAAS